MTDESFAVSVSRKRIRLTSERWTHIETRHPNLQGWRRRVLETVESPEFVVPGRHSELLAVSPYSHLGKTRFLVVVYRECIARWVKMDLLLRRSLFLMFGVSRRGVLCGQ